MKKPIVGELNASSDTCWWHLPNNIGVYQSGLDQITGDRYMLAWGEEIAGPVSKQMIQELFEVLLYPPGSVPSTESSDPTHKAQMKHLEQERQYDIPRLDIDNGDWY